MIAAPIASFDTGSIFGYGGGGVWGLNAATQQPQAAALNLDTLTNWRQSEHHSRI